MESETKFETKPEVVEVDVENKNAKRKKTRYYETYISKVLKSISTDGGITTNAKQQLNSVVCTIAKRISDLATKLTALSKKKTLSVKEVQNAIKITIPASLADECCKLADESLQKFSDMLVVHSSRQNKAGILFPPSITEKFLRQFGYSSVMITKTAPVYLACVLEYLTSYVVSRAISLAKESNRVRITIRDLELTVRSDTNLNELFIKCGASFLGGGVLPQIHESLLNKKPRKKKKESETEDESKKHRFRPGTVALREIRKLQKTSDCLIFAKFPFERFVREIVNGYQNGMKISKDTFIVLQYYIEQFIVEFLQDANAVAIHSNRVKLMPADIRFLAGLRKYKELKEEEFDENKNDLKVEEQV